MTLEEANKIGNTYARRIQACLRAFHVELGHLRNFPELISERKIAVYYLTEMKVNTHIISTSLNVDKWDIIKYVEAISKAMNEDPRMIEIFERIENEFQLLNENKS